MTDTTDQDYFDLECGAVYPPTANAREKIECGRMKGHPDPQHRSGAFTWSDAPLVQAALTWTTPAEHPRSWLMLLADRALAALRRVGGRA